MTSEHKKFVEEIGRCELCGSRRNLELHHIIPLVCEPVDNLNKTTGGINLDIEDNWIVVCCACHSKLTPKKLLTRIGLDRIRRADYKRRILANFYGYLNDIVEGYNERLEYDDYIKALEYALDLEEVELCGTTNQPSAV